MLQKLLIPLLIGGAVRYYLATSELGTIFSNRVEIATPLNAFKRLKEGVYLYEQGIDPYTGDIVHETPLVLLALRSLLANEIELISLLYVILDLVTAILLFGLSKHFVLSKIKQEKLDLCEYAEGTEELQIQKDDLEIIPRLVFFAYLFNPMILFNCAGLTSTVFSNLILAATLYCLVKGYLIPCLIFLAFESLRNLYPIVLIAPIIVKFSKGSVARAIAIGLLFCGACFTIAWLNFQVMHGWSFLDGTIGFIFFYRDLQPNIGLFWYFFTEMFDHFRTMFLITFQMNATVLYLIPLSFKLRKEPLLLATVLIALMGIFRSYPCLGDVGFYLALLPLWRRCWKFMAHSFVVFGFFMVTLSMMPALWYLWIYTGSANANFYFGTTLAFCTGQIFLVTDLLFAYVKRDFCLRNGQKIFINGKEAKIILE